MKNMNNEKAIIIYLSIITLNTSGCSSQKIQVAWMDKKTTPYLRNLLHIERYTQTESKGIKKDISWKQKQKKSGIAVLIPHKIEFKTRAITRNKEGPSNSTSEYLSKETQNTNLKRYIHPHVHCSIIYNRQDMETT